MLNFLFGAIAMLGFLAYLGAWHKLKDLEREKEGEKDSPKAEAPKASAWEPTGREKLEWRWLYTLRYDPPNQYSMGVQLVYASSTVHALAVAGEDRVMFVLEPDRIPLKLLDRIAAMEVLNRASTSMIDEHIPQVPFNVAWVPPEHLRLPKGPSWDRILNLMAESGNIEQVGGY